LNLYARSGNDMLHQIDAQQDKSLTRKTNIF